MTFDRDRANEARVAAALLALGIQRKNLISGEDFAKVLRYSTDSLNKMGVYVDLGELDTLDKMLPDDAVSAVNRVKSKLINGIGGVCDSATAALFELTFNFYLVVTTPEIIPGVESALKRMASAAGLQSDAFIAALRSAQIDTDSAITAFESAADHALRASDESTSAEWLQAIDIKPGVGGVSFDVKKAMSLAAKWIAGRRSQ